MQPNSPGPPANGREVRDLQVVLGVARAMAGAPDLGSLLTLILDALRHLLNAERSTLFLYDRATHELHGRIADRAEEVRFPADAGLAGAAARTRRTINIPDAYADPRFNREVDRQTGFRTRCLLTVPLTGTEDQLVGVVQVLNKADGVFTPYDEYLAEALAAQVGVAVQRATLLEHYVQKKQMEGALAIARDIQQGLLPRAAPRVAGYDLAGWSRPADQTGGDYYDFIPLADGRLAVVVADASGHGIGAALMISETRAYLRAFSGQTDLPTEVLDRANHWLCADQLEGRFVTAFFGILDPTGHRLDYASAGHGPLFWYDAGRKEVTVTPATGLMLAVLDPLPIRPVAPVAFAPGDLGVFLSDGLLEAPDPAGEQFGKERLIRVLTANAERPAAGLIEALRAAVDEFTAGGPQLDDFTVVVVKRCNG
jgi:sigma-B regulation protein RsbU (phosphoserine phosphatase)